MSYEIFHRTVTNTESYLPSFLLLLLIDVNKIDIMYSFCDLFLAAPSLDWIAEGSIEVQLIAFDVWNCLDLGFLAVYFGECVCNRGVAMATAEVDAVDFEPEEDDLLDDDVPMEDVEVVTAQAPKLKSTITSTGSGATSVGGGAGAAGRKTKGRGFREEVNLDHSNRFAAKEFESLDSGGGPGPQRCIHSILLPHL
jgi:hypothetical protein